jgi:hypothetical protein
MKRRKPDKPSFMERVETTNARRKEEAKQHLGVLGKALRDGFREGSGRR